MSCLNLLINKKELNKLLLQIMQSKKNSFFLKLLELVLEEKRREIIKEWIDNKKINS